MKKKKGLTLVELVAVMAIMVIVGGVVVSLLLGTNKMFNTVRVENILQDESRLIIESLENDIRIGKSKSATFDLSAKVVKIDGVNYGCSSFYTGQSNSKLLYTFTKKVGVNIETYAYFKIDKSLVKAKLVTTSSTVGYFKKASELTQNLDEDNTNTVVNINGNKVEVKFKLNTTTNEKSYSIIATQRN